MYDDLKRLANDLDSVEREVYRQQTYTQDPNLKNWCSSSYREIDIIKTELRNYIARVEQAGAALK
jgi:hypothetical protein